MISISDGIKSVGPSDLQSDGYIQFVPISKSVKGNEFIVTAQGDSVIVKIGTETFYPKPN